MFLDIYEECLAMFGTVEERLGAGGRNVEERLGMLGMLRNALECLRMF